jgi:hypothetical protein
LNIGILAVNEFFKVTGTTHMICIMTFEAINLEHGLDTRVALLGQEAETDVTLGDELHCLVLDGDGGVLVWLKRSDQAICIVNQVDAKEMLILHVPPELV